MVACLVSPAPLAWSGSSVLAVRHEVRRAPRAWSSDAGVSLTRAPGDSEPLDRTGLASASLWVRRPRCFSSRDCTSSSAVLPKTFELPLCTHRTPTLNSHSGLSTPVPTSTELRTEPITYPFRSSQARDVTAFSLSNLARPVTSPRSLLASFRPHPLVAARGQPRF